jgi:hypothetical protein
MKKDQENFILDIASGRFTPDEIFNMAVKIKANRIEHKNEVQNIKRKGGMSM